MKRRKIMTFSSISTFYSISSSFLFFSSVFWLNLLQFPPPALYWFSSFFSFPFYFPFYWLSFKLEQMASVFPLVDRQQPTPCRCHLSTSVFWYSKIFNYISGADGGGFFSRGFYMFLQLQIFQWGGWQWDQNNRSAI